MSCAPPDRTAGRLNVSDLAPVDSARGGGMFGPAMRRLRRTLLFVWSAVAAAAVLLVAGAQAQDSACTKMLGAAAVEAPGRAVAWRAEIEAGTPVFDRLPTKSMRPSRRLGNRDAPWLLV